MLIDIHTHISYGNFPEFAKVILNRPPFTMDILLRRMDIEGIDRSVLLPLSNPDNLDYYGVAGNQECIEAARKHPDRFDVFCNIDPRSMMNHDDTAISKLMQIYRDLGCKGIGEMCAGLYMDDPLYQRLFFNAGENNMPIIFHFKPYGSRSYGAIDDLGLPRTERMLKMFPQTMFIGHSKCFWNEISGGLTEENRQNYIKFPYEQRGRLWKLFESYSNLYGDLSAGSAYYALSCDPKGYEFLEKFHNRLFFGTDRFQSIDEPIPEIIGYLKEGKSAGLISNLVYERITYKNYLEFIE